jgi:hypothetical protein
MCSTLPRLRGPTGACQNQLSKGAEGSMHIVWISSLHKDLKLSIQSTGVHLLERWDKSHSPSPSIPVPLLNPIESFKSARRDSDLSTSSRVGGSTGFSFDRPPSPLPDYVRNGILYPSTNSLSLGRSSLIRLREAKRKVMQPKTLREPLCAPKRLWCWIQARH